ncbi:hypothetical protein D7X55_03215 [Corallococcus sp. AB049A]|nr:hypothetical protein D7X55_03215 [Corallococcus sp. AB049A]
MFDQWRALCTLVKEHESLTEEQVAGPWEGLEEARFFLVKERVRRSLEVELGLPGNHLEGGMLYLEAGQAELRL